MASQGPNNPGTSASTDLIGLADAVWSAPDESQTSNNTYANVTFTDLDQPSEALDNTNFSFSIPAGTINGIVVGIERSVSSGDVKDTVVQLIKGGTASGDNKHNAGVSWPGSDATQTYGTSSDLWGLSWSTSDINASNFGIRLVASEGGADFSAIGLVDHVTITVHYTAAAAAANLLSLVGVGT